MKTPFSAQNRSVYVNELATTSFDLLVIGGGITGAGIALDAAARGLRVALVEMQDFSSGTSSRSTKLIHGGLRYLKQLEFGLVAEVGKERKIIHRLAPHLAQPEPMLLPIMKGDTLGKFSARLGMLVYEELAGVKHSERNKNLTVMAAKLQEPLLKKEGLKGGILFYEYRTDDARLTLEVIKQAVHHGAVALNYLKVTGFKYDGGAISGVTANDLAASREIEIAAKYVVNASGPWVDTISGLDKLQDSKLKITKGVHLVFDHIKIPVRQSIYFEALDKRMLFVIPRNGKTYVGTTDTFYSGDLLEPLITIEDRDYLLYCLNNYFTLTLGPSDIESGWAGLRPLINKPGKKAGEISRKDEIFISPTGLITIAGGKLTGYRKMAERVMKLVSDNIRVREGKILPPCTTDNIYLSGGKLNRNFEDFVKDKITEGIKLGFMHNEIIELVYRYGSDVDTIYAIFKKLDSIEIQREAGDLPKLIYAQLLYAVDYEMCCTPSDFLVRRTGWLYFNIQLVEKWHARIADVLKKILQWEPDALEKYNNELESSLNRIRLLRR